MSTTRLRNIKYVVNNAKYVSINQNQLVQVCKSIKLNNHNTNQPYHKLVFNNLNERINFLLMFASINFAFWGSGLKYQKKGFDQHGSLAFMMHLYDHFKTISQLITTDQINKFTASDLNHIIDNQQILLLQERVNLIKQTAHALFDKLNNSYLGLLEKVHFDINKIIASTIKIIPSFKDWSQYDDKTIKFDKRIQALISHLYNFTELKHKVHNINTLTGLADYRLPQIFRHLGILKYTKSLEQIIDKQIELKHNSMQEIEIRCFTLWIIELMKKQLLSITGNQYSAIQLDNYFWWISRNNHSIIHPHHRTISIYY